MTWLGSNLKRRFFFSREVDLAKNEMRLATDVPVVGANPLAGDDEMAAASAMIRRRKWWHIVFWDVDCRRRASDASDLHVVE
mmetsp:Transcript_15412/g.25685  ORF Transcript_15412/g.25685 Transcript_15412/m.25685 type:complete len:82 (-) Transcript_15412:90-335(-)